MFRRFPRITIVAVLFITAAITATLLNDPNTMMMFASSKREAIIEAIKIRFVNHGLAIALGVFVGAFFTYHARNFRKWMVVIVFLLIGCATIWFDVYGGDVIFFITAFVSTYIIIETLYPAPPKKKSTLLGSAEWGDGEHIQKHKLYEYHGRFWLGVYKRQEEAYPLFYNGDRHLLTVAPTRSGKGVSSIIPNLLTYEGSAIVIDPKGENAMITSFRRGKGDQKKGISGMGQKVHIVDPWGITGLPISRFNPLDWLTYDLEGNQSENASMLAEAMVPQSAGAREQFWDDEARSLLKGFLLWVAQGEGEDEGIKPIEPEETPETDKKEEPPAEGKTQNENEEEAAFTAMMAEAKEGARQPQPRTLGRVRDIISEGKHVQDAVFKAMLFSKNTVIRSAASRTLSKEERLRSSVMATLQAHTDFLDSPRIRENLAVSDFFFEDLKKSKMTVYLVLPADRLKTFNRWLRLLIQQAITINARNIDEKPPKPILFMLDEMAALGHLSMVEQAYSLMAGFGMQLWGIIQDVSQLESIYGKGWQTFIGNSGMIQYFGSRDVKTAEYFSKMIGVTTLEKTTISRSIARVFANGISGGSKTETTSTNEDVSQRSLAYPDELMVMPDDQEIVFVENCNPIRGIKVPWYTMEEIKTYGVNLRSKLTG